MAKATRSGASPVEAVLASLRARGARITSPRRLLIEAIFEAGGHRTAEELAADVRAKSPDVNISTIYRNLDSLEDLGVVTHAHLGHGPATYHVADTAHGHLVCETCGVAIEAPLELFSHLSEAAESQFGFRIDSHHFAIPGHCRRCR